MENLLGILPWPLLQFQIPVSWLEFLPQLLFRMGCKLYGDINPSLPGCFWPWSGSQQQVHRQWDRLGRGKRGEGRAGNSSHKNHTCICAPSTETCCPASFVSMTSSGPVRDSITKNKGGLSISRKHIESVLYPSQMNIYLHMFTCTQLPSVCLSVSLPRFPPPEEKEKTKGCAAVVG